MTKKIGIEGLSPEELNKFSLLLTHVQKKIAESDEFKMNFEKEISCHMGIPRSRLFPKMQNGSDNLHYGK
jgi:hypothetical protein